MKYHQIGTKLLFAALLLLQGCGPAEPLRTEAATVLPQPKAIADVDFHSHSQEGMRLSDLKGKWSLVFFGYTRCPDVCPTELFTLAEMSLRRCNSTPVTTTLHSWGLLQSSKPLIGSPVQWGPSMSGSTI